MKALKILVIAMGVLLVGGTVALAVLVAGRIGRAPAPDAAAPLHAALPAGSRILATELNGDRLLVRLALPDGSEQLILYNTRNGAPVAVLDLPVAAR